MRASLCGKTRGFSYDMVVATTIKWLRLHYYTNFLSQFLLRSRNNLSASQNLSRVFWVAVTKS